MTDPELSATLARGRAWRTGIMLDTVTVTRQTGRTYNEVSRTYSATVLTVYTGQARIVPWRGNDEQAAETEVTVYRYRIQFPLTATSPEIKRQDVVTVTASTNPTMVGKVLNVTEPEIGTTATALVVTAELVS